MIWLALCLGSFVGSFVGSALVALRSRLIAAERRIAVALRNGGSIPGDPDE